MKLYKSNTFLWVLVIFLGLNLPQSTLAQKTTATLRQQELNLLWQQQGKNAAALQLEQPFDYTLLTAGVQSSGGTFRKAMDPKHEEAGFLSAEGGMRLHDFFLWGRFDYDRRSIKKLPYNASIINPYRGMPYFVTDKNESDWRNQYYDLEFKVAAPRISNFLTFGLAGGYEATSAAKQRDIRTQNYAMELFLEPSLLLEFSRNTQMGLTFLYASHKEESSMHNVNVYIDQDYYELFGLGFGTKRIGSGRTTDYVGESIGGGVQLGYRGNRFKALLDGRYTLRVEDVRLGFSQPMDFGTTRTATWDTALRVNTLGTRNSHHFMMDYHRMSNDGIQYISLFDNTENFKGYVTLLGNVRASHLHQHIGLSYTWMHSQGSEYLWTLGAKGRIGEVKKNYLLPNSSTRVKYLDLNLQGQRNWVLSSTTAQRLELNCSLAYRSTLTEEANFDKNSTDSFLVEKIELHDHHYMSAPNLRGELSLTYLHPVGAKKSNQVFLTLMGRYAQAVKSDHFGGRYVWGISWGYLF